ncbi:hypothetical protein DNTS_027275, partial [Danionella cerebrum]
RHNRFRVLQISSACYNFFQQPTEAPPEKPVRDKGSQLAVNMKQKVCEQQLSDDDVDMEIENSRWRAGATVRFVVERISMLRESVISPPFFVRNLPWTILVKPRFNQNQPNDRRIGFYLQCNTESASRTWGCQAQAILRVINYKDEEMSFSRLTNHLYFYAENDWGFPAILPWDVLTDPARYFVEDDKVTFEVSVQADPPR